MKKIFLLVFACLFFIFIGCENPANSSSQNNNQNNSSEESGNEEAGENGQEDSDLEEEVEDTSLFKKGDIYAVITKDNGEVAKREYIQFTTKESGDFYKNGSIYRPDSNFEYDSDGNLFVVGLKPYYLLTAGDELFWSDGYGEPVSGTSLVGKWNIGIATVNFTASGLISGSNTQGLTFSGTYKNKNGLVTVTYIDSDGDSGTLLLYYSSDEGRLYMDLKELRKVVYVGEIPHEAEVEAPVIDKDGFAYATLDEINLSSGIYGCNIYDSLDYKYIDYRQYFDFATKTSSLYYKNSISSTASGTFETQTLDNGLLKIIDSETVNGRLVTENYYVLKLLDNSYYIVESESYEATKQEEEKNTLYGTYSYRDEKNNGFSIKFGKNGKISGSDDNGDISGSYVINDGIVKALINHKNNFSYESIVLTGVYFYDNDKEEGRLLLGAQPFLKTDAVAGDLVSTADNKEKLVELVESSYKLPEVTAYTVGDIVCSDGSIIQKKDGKYQLPAGKTPVAVIFKLSDGGKTGLGLGLYQTSAKWTTEKSNGYNNFFVTRQEDGSANWEIISNQDLTDSAAASLYYPMFSWADLYGTTYYALSEYIDGWFVPSVNEFTLLYNNKEYVETVLKEIGGTELSGNYWTSCQYSDPNTNSKATLFNYTRGSSSSVDKSVTHFVRVIRKFSIE